MGIRLPIPPSHRISCRFPDKQTGPESKIGSSSSLDSDRDAISGIQNPKSRLSSVGDARLLGRQELLELLLELGDPHVAVHDFSLTVDQKHRRQRDDAVVDRQAAIHAAGFVDLRPGELVLLEECVHVGTVVVDIDTDDLKPATVILIVDRDQVRRVGLDLRGPTRPEDDEHRLAEQLRASRPPRFEGPFP